MKRRKKVSASIFAAASVVFVVAILFSKHPKEIALGGALGMVMGMSLVLRATYERVDPSNKQTAEEGSN